MAINSFLKVEKGDPDWQFSPEQYFGKEVKIIDASNVEMSRDNKEQIVLRQNPTDKGLVAKHIRIELKENSELDLTIINDLDNHLQQIFLYDIILNEGSSINFGIFAHGGKFNKHIIQVAQQAGSNFNAFGLIANTAGGDTELITKTIHQHPYSKSRQLILGRAGPRSQTVFQGMVILNENSIGGEASVENMNLITGPKGRCFSKPEIYTNCDGVKTQMGSITETLSEEKIYYLQARGLDPKTATNTIISSFQNQVIDLLSFDDLNAEVKQIFN
jgi:Fe-S cluster assembly scaffold protein SufB